MSDDLAQEKMIRDCCQEVLHLDGDAAEIGVHQGQSALLICRLLEDSAVYLFDTFSGMPEEMITAGVDYHRAKAFDDTSVNSVKLRLSAVDNAVIIPGVFPRSATVKPRIKFAHIDVDLYLSTKAALEWCWTLLVDGGVILNDDYGCGTCGGAKKAVDEFCAATGASCEVKLNRAILRRLPNAH